MIPVEQNLKTQWMHTKQVKWESSFFPLCIFYEIFLAIHHIGKSGKKEIHWIKCVQFEVLPLPVNKCSPKKISALMLDDTPRMHVCFFTLSFRSLGWLQGHGTNWGEERQTGRPTALSFSTLCLSPPFTCYHFAFFCDLREEPSTSLINYGYI